MKTTTLLTSILAVFVVVALTRHSVSEDRTVAPPVMQTGACPPLPVTAPACPGEAPTTDAAGLLGNLPATFIENRGQWAPSVRYLMSMGGMAAAVQDHGWTLLLARRKGSRARPSINPQTPGPAPIIERASVTMTFAGARDSLQAEPETLVPGYHNFLRGSRRGEDCVEVPAYRRIHYRAVYPGIDVLVRESGGRMEYDLLLEPSADLSEVTVVVEGAEGLDIDADGRLVIETCLGPIVQPLPKTWETLPDGQRIDLPCHYVLRQPNAFGFEAEEWNGENPLVVDPQLEWSTYTGGTVPSCWDDVLDVAVDDSGIVTAIGRVYQWVSSSDFPTTPGAYITSTPDRDTFVMRLDPSQSGSAQLVYSTFLGLRSYQRGCIGLGSDGSVVFGAGPAGPDLPQTPGAFQEGNPPASGIYVARLNPPGTGISFATYLGGSSYEYLADLAVDRTTGQITVIGTTNSSDFPTTQNAYRTTAALMNNVAGGECAGFQDEVGFAARLDPAISGQSQLVWSTYLPGDRSLSGCFLHDATALAVNSAGTVAIAGRTFREAFPTTPGAPDEPAFGGFRRYLVRMDPSQSGSNQLTWSAAFGEEWGTGQYDRLSMDSAGVITVASLSAPTFLHATTPGALQSGPSGGMDMFIMRVDPDLTPLDPVLWSTYLGGSGDDRFTAMAVDTDGTVTVGGWTYSSDYPVTAGAYDTSYDGQGEAFITRISADGTSLVASTYFGGSESEDWVYGIALRPGGLTYVGGGTYCSDLPVTPGAHQESAGGAYPDIYNGFVARLDLLNSQSGTNVTVSPDPDSSLTFGEITTPGETAVFYSTTAPELPAGFELGGPDAQGTPVFIEITTTASFAGSVALSFHYDENLFVDEAAIRLLHYEGGEWVDITTSLDTVNDIVYGTTTSFSPFAIVQGPMSVAIDIRPGSYPNPINLGSNGVVPVAIFGSLGLDVYTIDPLSVSLANATVKLKGNGSPQSNYQDVNQDGYPDLVIHVITDALTLTPTSVEAVLIGQLMGDSRFIQGIDTVHVVP